MKPGFQGICEWRGVGRRPAVEPNPGDFRGSNDPPHGQIPVTPGATFPREAPDGSRHRSCRCPSRPIASRAMTGGDGPRAGSIPVDRQSAPARHSCSTSRAPVFRSFFPPRLSPAWPGLARRIRHYFSVYRLVRLPATGVRIRRRITGGGTCWGKDGDSDVTCTSPYITFRQIRASVTKERTNEPTNSPDQNIPSRG